MKDINIIKFIRSAMQAEGVTLEEMGKRTGYTKQNVWLRLNKYEDCKWSIALKMLDALGYEVEIKKKEKP